MKAPDYSLLEFWQTATKHQCGEYFESHCYKWFFSKYCTCYAYRCVAGQTFGLFFENIDELGMTELQAMRVIGAALQVLEARP